MASEWQHLSAPERCGATEDTIPANIEMIETATCANSTLKFLGSILQRRAASLKDYDIMSCSRQPNSHSQADRTATNDAALGFDCASRTRRLQVDYHFGLLAAGKTSGPVRKYLACRERLLMAWSKGGEYSGNSRGWELVVGVDQHVPGQPVKWRQPSECVSIGPWRNDCHQED